MNLGQIMMLQVPAMVPEAVLAAPAGEQAAADMAAGLFSRVMTDVMQDAGVRPSAVSPDEKSSPADQDMTVTGDQVLAAVPFAPAVSPALMAQIAMMHAVPLRREAFSGQPSASVVPAMSPVQAPVPTNPLSAAQEVPFRQPVAGGEAAEVRQPAPLPRQVVPQAVSAPADPVPQGEVSRQMMAAAFPAAPFETADRPAVAAAASGIPQAAGQQEMFRGQPVPLRREAFSGQPSASVVPAMSPVQAPVPTNPLSAAQEVPFRQPVAGGEAAEVRQPVPLPRQVVPQAVSAPADPVPQGEVSRQMMAAAFPAAPFETADRPAVAAAVSGAPVMNPVQAPVSTNHLSAAQEVPFRQPLAGGEAAEVRQPAPLPRQVVPQAVSAPADPVPQGEVSRTVGAVSIQPDTVAAESAGSAVPAAPSPPADIPVAAPFSAVQEMPAIQQVSEVDAMVVRSSRPPGERENIATGDEVRTAAALERRIQDAYLLKPVATTQSADRSEALSDVPSPLRPTADMSEIQKHMTLPRSEGVPADARPAGAESVAAAVQDNLEPAMQQPRQDLAAGTVQQRQAVAQPVLSALSANGEITAGEARRGRFVPVSASKEPGPQGIQPQPAVSGRMEQELSPDREGSSSFPFEGNEQNPAPGQHTLPGVQLAGEPAGRTAAAGAAPLADDSRAVPVARVAEHLAETLARHEIKAGTEQVSIRLSPEHLGELRMNFRMEGQRLNVEIITESSQVREMIHQHSDTLRDALSRQNITMESFDVTSGGRWNGTGGQGQHQQEWRELSRQRQQSAAWSPPGGYRQAEPPPSPTAVYQTAQAYGMVDLHF